MNNIPVWGMLAPPLFIYLGQFDIVGSAIPGTPTDTQVRAYPFSSIQFQVLASTGASPVLTFDISTDGNNWRQCTFAESANTANVNSVTSPPVGYIGIVTIKSYYWRLRLTGAGTTISVRVIGLN